MAESDADLPTDVLPSDTEGATAVIIASRVLIGAFVAIVFVGTLIAAWPILLVVAAIAALSTGIDAWARRRSTTRAARTPSELFAPRLGN
jgi:hypothetical protein